MSACGKGPACQSVDWQAETGTCYFGKHSGEATISVSGWASAYSLGCTGACKESGCYSCASQGDGQGRQCCKTCDETAEDPNKPLPTPPQCGNQGLNWAQYENTQGPNQDTTYSQFIPELYKTVNPGTSGITTTIGGIDAVGGQQISVYGSSDTFPGDYFALDHTGYLFASVEGKYKFTVSNVDDTAFLWLGGTAVKGWTRKNADLVIGLSKTETAEIDIPRGVYMPIRIMMAQGQGAAKFKMQIEGPDGQIIADSSTKGSPWVLQYSCDGYSAPKFPIWGQEE